MAMKMPSSSAGAARVSRTRWNSRRRPAPPGPGPGPPAEPAADRCGGAGSSGGDDGLDEDEPDGAAPAGGVVPATRRRWNLEKISLISDEDDEDLVELRLRRAVNRTGGCSGESRLRQQ